MASPEEAQGLQQPTRMRKLGHVLHRPSGKCRLIQLHFLRFYQFNLNVFSFELLVASFGNVFFFSFFYHFILNIIFF